MTPRHNCGTFDTRGDRATTKRPRYRAPDSVCVRSWFQFRCGPPDLARIDALSAALGVTRSEAVRRAVERLAEDLIPENH